MDYVPKDLFWVAQQDSIRALTIEILALVFLDHLDFDHYAHLEAPDKMWWVQLRLKTWSTNMCSYACVGPWITAIDGKEMYLVLLK